MPFDFPYETISEGEAVVAVPKLSAFKKAPWEYAPSKAPVFYNPIMRLNRDIAIVAIQVFQRITGREITVAEPLAGCGVRGIRFALEIEGIRHVYMNDLNPKAYEMAKYNVEMNRLSDAVTLSNEDANLFMSKYAAPRRRFDCIDIDPFGSPTPFLDSAIRALRDGGLLALTATDMAPLCGVHPKAALRKYGGLSIRTEYCHEIAMRLLIGSLVMAAAKHDIGVKVLFSHKSNHYIRVYAMLLHGARRADESIEEMGYIMHCFNCFHRETFRGFTCAEKRCRFCGAAMEISGPLWLGRLADGDFCERMEEEALRRKKLDRRVKNIISTVHRESDGPATYFVIDKICDKLGLPSPPMRRVVENLMKKNFKVWPTHFNPNGIRTDAPARIVIESVKMSAQPPP